LARHIWSILVVALARPLKKTLWRFGKASLWLFVLLLALLVAALLINASDEDLKPETVALLTAPPNPYPANVNLYLALGGLDAPSGASTIAFGEARVSDYEAKRLKGPKAFMESSESKDPKTLTFNGSLENCQPLVRSIWDGIENRRTELDQLLADNGELYERYRALPNAAGYYETATPSVYAMPFTPSQPLRHLFLAHFAQRMKAGSHAEQAAALAEMTNDLGVWRAMLVGEGTLVSKMIAAAYLQADFLVLGDMIADSQVDLAPWKVEMDRLVSPFGLDDWKIGKVFASEFRFTSQMLDSVDDVVNSWRFDELAADAQQSVWQVVLGQVLRPFFKKQATKNGQAKAMLQFMTIADGTPATLDQAFQARSVGSECVADLRIHCVYNPIGKILVGIGLVPYATYPLRVYDAAAMQRLVKLAYEIRVRQISPGEIGIFIGQHPEWATHPVGGRAFEFDATTVRLIMKPMGQQPKDRRFGIPVWRQTS
jgi:hypothetical protein